MNLPTIKKKAKKPGRILIRWISLGTVLYLFIFQKYGLLQMGKMMIEKREITQKIERLRKQNQNLLIQEQALQADLNAIEKVAREKYFLAKEGERIFRVIPQTK